MCKSRPYLPHLLLFFLSACYVTTASAQTNLGGVWLADYTEDRGDRIPGPALGDYGGLPLNDANRLRAQSWSASLLGLPEYQCRVHPSDYAHSFNNINLREERDPRTLELIAIHLEHFTWQTRRVIWMDGREHPPEYAAHTSMGFSTGEWLGHKLKVTTTHLKEGWLRRNGVARSDQASVTEYFIRHGNLLVWTVIVDDPVYLEEPIIRNRNYNYSTEVQILTYPCESVIEIVHEPGYIPHYLPGNTPYLFEFADSYNIPHQATLGGAATMYPEYRKFLLDLPSPSTTQNQE
ncbi:MAG: hypothetical protein COA71_08220 [SAR86 cluster bacterium]|uniref:Uncharacterized protein n=1 Tax=SAR86 cluster bacterium TaxID=2030880 RepID=A0A2A5CCM2_9GAMM|nr:MAG: hypothetical protein COA71_08220 [SAR86 cluster bacterium]